MSPREQELLGALGEQQWSARWRSDSAKGKKPNSWWGARQRDMELRREPEASLDGKRMSDLADYLDRDGPNFVSSQRSSPGVEDDPFDEVIREDVEQRRARFRHVDRRSLGSPDDPGTAPKKLRAAVWEADEMWRLYKKRIALEDTPARFPTYRKAHDWEQRVREGRAGPGGARSGTETSTPSESPDSNGDDFFSQKLWSEIPSMSSEMVDLAVKLRLPRPSRVQNRTYNTLATGKNAVIADHAGSGKTLAYLLPLLQRHVMRTNPDDHRLKLLVIAPTSDLAKQIRDVARVVSVNGPRQFWVHSFITHENDRDRQLGHMEHGVDVAIFTPGRLRWFLYKEKKGLLDLSAVKAVVFDEADQLLSENCEIKVTIDDIRQKVSTASTQWVFVTATLGEEVRQTLDEFEALPSVTPLPLPGQPPPPRGLKWHTGPGLHKVSLNCEHVLVDVTPEGFSNIQDPEVKFEKAMRNKILALVWHLKHGVLSDMEDDRIVIFCNSIDNCRMVENELRRRDPKDQRTRKRCWKVMVLHSARHQSVYDSIVYNFNSNELRASNFFQKKVLISTDRLARGMDFKKNAVQWVVLFDWPRDANEYIRRVGRTARAGNRGGCLAFAAGYFENTMAKKTVAAALRGKRLDATGAQEMELKVGVLEKFDPAAPDWRAPEAQMERPRRIAEEEERRSEQKALERQTGPLTGRYNHSSDVEDRDAARRDRMAEADARRRSDVWSQMDEPTERTQPEDEDEELAAASWGPRAPLSSRRELEEEQRSRGDGGAEPQAQGDALADQDAWSKEFLQSYEDGEAFGSYGVSLGD